MKANRKRLLLNSPQPIGARWMLLSQILFLTCTFSVVLTFKDFLRYDQFLSKFNLNHSDIIISLLAFNVASIIGGFIGQSVGYKKSIIIGMVFSATGIVIVLISNLALIGLITYIVGIGVTLPNLYSALSMFYTRDDYRRYVGFILMYITGVIAAFIAISLSSLLAILLGFYHFYLILAFITIISIIPIIYSNNEFEKNTKIVISPIENENQYSIIGIYSILIVSVIALMQITTDYIYYLLFISLIIFSSLVLISYLIIKKNKKNNLIKSFLPFIIIICGLACLILVGIENKILFEYDKLFFKPNSYSLASMINYSVMSKINNIFILIFGFIVAIIINKNKIKLELKTINSFYFVSASSAFIGSVFFLASIYLSNSGFNALSICCLFLFTVFSALAQIIVIPLLLANISNIIQRFYEPLAMGLFSVLISSAGFISYVYSHGYYLDNKNYIPSFMNYIDIPIIFAITALILLALYFGIFKKNNANTYKQSPN